MILGKSIDKAQIKKIPIRVWSLTDEINATLKALNEDYDHKIPEDKYILIKAFYEATSPADLNKKPALTLIDGGKDNPSTPKTSEEGEAPKPSQDASPENSPGEQEKEQKPLSPSFTQQDFLNLRKEGIRMYPGNDLISSGHCIIYDINLDQILFFTEKPFKPGQEIIIEFSIHKTFTVAAKVINIFNVGVGSRVISTQPVHFRINAQLTHEHLGDRTLIRNFLAKLDPSKSTSAI